MTYLRTKTVYARREISTSQCHTSEKEAVSNRRVMTTHHTTRQSAGQQREAQEEHQLGFPCHAITAIAEAIGRQSPLIDAVDNEHAERGTYERDPVNKGYVELFGTILIGFGVGGGIDESVEAAGELSDR